MGTVNSGWGFELSFLTGSKQKLNIWTLSVTIYSIQVKEKLKDITFRKLLVIGELGGLAFTSPLITHRMCGLGQ